MRWLAALLAVASMAACASTTTIHSEPKGAQVYINGRSCGEAPCIYHTRYGFPDRMRVQIIKDGYEPVEVFVDTSAPLGSYLLYMFGSYVFHTFDEEYRFALTPLPAKPQAPEVPAAPEMGEPSAPTDDETKQVPAKADSDGESP